MGVAGNTTGDTRSGTAYAYTINDAGRISQLTIGGTVKANYTYDAKNRLSIRQTLNMTPVGTTHLIHDKDDHVIVETNGAGTAVREYVWVGDLPVAVLDGSTTPSSPTLLWVHADHLKRPELMTDASKTVVWKALYEPFGAVSSITGAAANNQRFPGQWFQLEAGLHYNWWRDYDPTLGRYTQPDPLGLSRGPRPNTNAGTAPVQNGTPGASVWSTGLPGSMVGRQAGLLAGLATLQQDGRQNPLGLATDLAASFNPAATSTRDGPSLYGYARQTPQMRVDPKGLQYISPDRMSHILNGHGVNTPRTRAGNSRFNAEYSNPTELQNLCNSDLPVAVLDGSSTPSNPTLPWVDADHLKRPELMTDATKAVKWKAIYEPFGAVSSITGAAANNQRFPGQWFQLEAGLHYNWWRHYDPTLGRYTQPDPLGLAQEPTAPSTAGAAPVQNGTPGASMWSTGLPSASVGRQAGLLAGLVSLQQDGRQDPLGLETDFAASYNSGTTSTRDGRNLYGYARQTPGMRVDPDGRFFWLPALAAVGVAAIWLEPANAPGSGDRILPSNPASPYVAGAVAGLGVGGGALCAMGREISIGIRPDIDTCRSFYRPDHRPPAPRAGRCPLDDAYPSAAHQCRRTQPDSSRAAPCEIT